MSSYYEKAGLQCAQGSPRYWERTWSFVFNSGVSQFASQGLAQRTVTWQLGNVAATPVSGAVQYEAPTSGGEQTWLTVTPAGDVTSAGFGGSSPDSYLRCGNLAQAGPPIGEVSVTLVCRVTDAGGGDASSYPLTFRVNTARFPYTSIALAGGGGRGQIVDDPDGGLLANGQVAFVQAAGSPDSAQFALAAGTNRQSLYYLYQGTLVSVNIGLPGVSVLQSCNLP